MWRYDQARTHARSRNESPNKSPVGEGESGREGKEIRGRGKFKARLLGGRKGGNKKTGKALDEAEEDGRGIREEKKFLIALLLRLFLPLPPSSPHPSISEA